MSHIDNLDSLVEAIKLIKPFEGCKLKAYRCPAGIWTIGWGETQGIREGMVWTQEKADEVLRQRAAQFLMAVYKIAPILFLEPAGRAGACTSLAYNIGLGAFKASSVSRKTRNHDWAGAADSFLLWNKGGGRVLRGLILRRQAERRVYLGS
jgi:lysozyme